mgnify:CR=1 FL=1
MYNANNYGYNPYGTYVPQRPMEQPMQQQPIQRPILNGKQVDSIEVAKSVDYPLDGSISYFPLTDNSAIVTKQIGVDGTSKITIYKPFKEDLKEQPKYLTDEDLDDIKDDIRKLRDDLKDLRKKKRDE